MIKRSAIKPMRAELAAMLRGPLQPLVRHEQRSWRRATIDRGGAAQACRDLARTVGRQQHGPTQHQDETSQRVRADPARHLQVQCRQDVVAHHPANLDHRYAVVHRRHSSGRGSKRPSFFVLHRSSFAGRAGTADALSTGPGRCSG
jgi:hypothetical protein